MKWNSSFTLCAFFMGLVLTSCSDEKKTSGTVDDMDNITMGSSYVQKGPFVQGSQISVQELDSVFIPLGRTYMTETNDDFGSFSLASELQSPIIEMTADGYYFNEVTGKIDGPIVLKMVAKIQDEMGITINILTTLAKERIKYLVTQEQQDFSVAKNTAEQEILEMFGFPESDLAGGIVGFEAMNIADSGNANAMLLAASVILQGQLSTGELSELISKVSNDMKTDGILSDSTLKAKLKANALSIDTAAVRSNLKTRYKEIGVEAVIPRFEDYLDSDGDGYINKFDHNLAIGDYLRDSLNYVFDGITKPIFTWGAVAGVDQYRLVITEVGSDPFDMDNAVYTSEWISATSHQPSRNLEIYHQYQVVVMIGESARAPMQKFAIIQGEMGPGIMIDDFADSAMTSIEGLQHIKGNPSNAKWGLWSVGMTGTLETEGALHLDVEASSNAANRGVYAYLPLMQAKIDSLYLMIGAESEGVNFDNMDSISFEYATTSVNMSVNLYFYDSNFTLTTTQGTVEPGSIGTPMLIYSLPAQPTKGRISISRQQLLNDSFNSMDIHENGGTEPLKRVVAVGFSYWDGMTQETLPLEFIADNIQIYGTSVTELTSPSGEQ